MCVTSVKWVMGLCFGAREMSVLKVGIQSQLLSYRHALPLSFAKLFVLHDSKDPLGSFSVTR